MKTEIELLIHTKSGLGVPFADYTPSRNDDYEYKIRKAVLWPNGTVHSKYYLTFTTGEWVRVPEGSTIPDECLMDDNLRHMLDPERKHAFMSPAAQGLQHAFDAEEDKVTELGIFNNTFPVGRVCVIKFDQPIHIEADDARTT